MSILVESETLSRKIVCFELPLGVEGVNRWAVDEAGG
jgi:hypothetical protein